MSVSLGGGPRRPWSRRAADRRSTPPPLLELALFGLRAQPVRELAASQSKENQGKRLGFPWIPLAELGLFKGLQRIQIKKSAANSTRLASPRLGGCARTPVLNATPPSLAPSDPLIVNCPPQKSIVCFSVFVNELDGGLKVGDPAQNEPRGQRRQISSGPWWSWGWRVLPRSNQNEPRGCPPSDPRRRQARGEKSCARRFPCGRKHFRRKFKARGRRADRVIVEASSSSDATMIAGLAMTVSRALRSSIQLYYLPIPGRKRSSSLHFDAPGKRPPTLRRRTRLTDAGCGGQSDLGFPARGRGLNSDRPVPKAQRPQHQGQNQSAGCRSQILDVPQLLGEQGQSTAKSCSNGRRTEFFGASPGKCYFAFLR
jgi:hypothetical protein